MALDTLGGERGPPANTRSSFDEFYLASFEKLAAAAWLTVGDRDLADEAFDESMTRARRGWRHIPKGQSPAALVFLRSFMLVHQPPEALVRSGPVDLETIIAELPIGQRAALVGTYFLGWPLDHLAQALGVSADAVAKRLALACAYISKREQQHDAAASAAALAAASVIEQALADSANAGDPVAQSDLEERLAHHFATKVSGYRPGSPRLGKINRAALVRQLARRVAAAAAVVGVIAIAASLVDFDPPSEDEAAAPVDTRQVVDPPGVSGRTFGPFADGKGGFVSMTAESGALFSNAADGIDWRRESLWNFRAVDIRLILTDFVRTGGRYAVTLEPLSHTGGTIPDVSPRIAVSDDLGEWRLHRLDPGQFADTPGVVPSIDVVGVAAAGANLAASVRVDEAVDYRVYGIDESDVCVLEERDDRITVHLCTGDTIDVAESIEQDRTETVAGDYLYLSENGAPFVAVDPPAAFDPYGLFSFGERFGVLDRATGVLSASEDGRIWEVIYDLATNNRLGLAAGSDTGEVMMVNPASGGWTSYLLSDGVVRQGALPINLEPEAIWVKPQIVSGPAGWAVFVTTSRPWERFSRSEFGWAVRTDDWIASQLPGSDAVSLRSIDGSVSYRYAPRRAWPDDASSPPAIAIGIFGGVRLFEPGTGELLVEISGDRIRASRVADAESVALAPLAESGGPTPRLVTSEGYALAGNLTVGPIIVTAPDGTTTEYADGFVFTNGDISDGVEADVFTGAADPTFRFFDPAGRLEFEIAAADLDVALRPAETDALTGGAPRALIAFSSDGVDWRTIWQTNDDTWYATVAVGDLEVLLTAAQLTGGPIVIQLDGR